MDSRRLAIGFLILAGCGTSPNVRYQNGRLLLKQGRLDEAMREADAGLRAEPSWRFRILKADILLTRFDVDGARQLLTSTEIPSDQESLARLRMDQGWLEYMRSNYSGAEQLLQQAGEVANRPSLPVVEAMIENREGLVEVQQGRMDAA